MSNIGSRSRRAEVNGDVSDRQVRALIAAIRSYIAQLAAGRYEQAHADLHVALVAMAAMDLPRKPEHYKDQVVPRLEQARAIVAALRAFSVTMATGGEQQAITDLSVAMDAIEAMRYPSMVRKRGVKHEPIDILYVWHKSKVKPESWACIEAAEKVGHHIYRTEVRDGVKGTYDYWHAMNDAFKRGRAFLNIEHDNVLTLSQIADIEACPNPLCMFAYPFGMPNGQARDFVALGATRFSEEVVRKAAPAIALMGEVPYAHIETVVFFSIVQHFPKTYHRHLPNALHIGHPNVRDRTGLPPGEPEALCHETDRRSVHHCVHGHRCIGDGNPGHGCSVSADGLFYEHPDESRRSIDTASDAYLMAVKRNIAERIQAAKIAAARPRRRKPRLLEAVA